jgi:hypothetical protein
MQISSYKSGVTGDFLEMMRADDDSAVSSWLVSLRGH